ncbi:HlyD family efflux transporter periplasmic adaptor subunit [Wenzhouxiangella sp. XN79A]|uniref:efflux RND transporter periplasmic adaptor subunit n=1 Tax=Wenzhouxiangella sp. XN79A TaxID=2724193 RepID=UPI00144A99B5|nr:efflux RND transporter periplasmic adaptor subunit [Wenzhouxiangella sp. XN79A]NKI36187.1 HlyD family efflux transporter periplasmic adaptor subunit [Wenzhouxiangella sp. XN79A]
MTKQRFPSAALLALSLTAAGALTAQDDRHDVPSTGTESSSMDHASMDHSSMDHSSMDHSSMDHSSMDHSSMDHSSMDHSSMDHSSMDHSSMDHSSMDQSAMAPDADPQPAAAGEREIAYWVAPMDPNFRRDRPGKSPMGMDLVPVYVDELAPPGTVRVGEAVQQQMNLRTARVREGRLWRRIDTVGRVTWDAERLSHVHSRVSGWIGELAVDAVGDRIEAGSLLYTLYSPELANAQDELLRARNGGAGLLSSARARLRTLGVQDAVIERIERDGRALEYLPWYAERSGVVSMLGARDGMRVTPDLELFEIAAETSIWVIADVAGRQVDWLAEGQVAEITTDYRPGTTFRARIDYLYPELDPVTRTQRVRLPVALEVPLLKPGMWVDVRIFAGPVDGNLFVPREALIRTGQNERVIVRTDAESFEVRDVTSGMESGEFVAILAGLRPGETVVTSGQFLLDSEANVAADGARMEGGGHAHH